MSTGIAHLSTCLQKRRTSRKERLRRRRSPPGPPDAGDEPRADSPSAASGRTIRASPWQAAPSSLAALCAARRAKPVPGSRARGFPGPTGRLARRRCGKAREDRAGISRAPRLPARLPGACCAVMNTMCAILSTCPRTAQPWLASSASAGPPRSFAVGRQRGNHRCRLQDPDNAGAERRGPVSRLRENGRARAARAVAHEAPQGIAERAKAETRRRHRRRSRCRAQQPTLV
jgi:hypothetical protein